MTGEADPPRRRRRRAVWRAGAAIARSDERAAVPADPGLTDPGSADPGPATASTVAASDDAPHPRPGPESHPTPESHPAPERTPGPRPGARRRLGDPSERGLRDLVGGGPSQLGPVRAMRARDLNRPTDEDLTEAEQDVVLVRRHWKPPKP